jgi:hypothetical protein
MPAYLRRTIDEFLREESIAVIGILQQAYASDGFVSQYTRQTRAWDQIVPELQRVFTELLKSRPEAKDWTVLLQYPLYRLRRRIDAVVLAHNLIVVIECKVGTDVSPRRTDAKSKNMLWIFVTFMRKVIIAK